jgi:hypothetical protein
MNQTQIQKQQQENNEIQYPPTTVEATYPYSVKIEQTVKGSRVSVHVYNRFLELAVKEAIETYLNTRRKLKELGLKVAPEE